MVDNMPTNCPLDQMSQVHWRDSQRLEIMDRNYGVMRFYGHVGSLMGQDFDQFYTFHTFIGLK